METKLRTKKEFLEYLQKTYEEEWLDNGSKVDYVSDQIFDFITYDGAMNELFVKKALEVCDAITARTTFTYIKDKDNYRWFLLMANIPFFREKTEWGTSVRGAWWCSGPGSDKYSLPSLDLEIQEDVWDNFILAVIEFVKGEITEETPNNPAT